MIATSALGAYWPRTSNDRSGKAVVYISATATPESGPICSTPSPLM
jgi:hypothetical protein